MPARTRVAFLREPREPCSLPCRVDAVYVGSTMSKHHPERCRAGQRAYSACSRYSTHRRAARRVPASTASCISCFYRPTPRSPKSRTSAQGISTSSLTRRKSCTILHTPSATAFAFPRPRCAASGRPHASRDPGSDSCALSLAGVEMGRSVPDLLLGGDIRKHCARPGIAGRAAAVCYRTGDLQLLQGSGRRGVADGRKRRGRRAHARAGIVGGAGSMNPSVVDGPLFSSKGSSNVLHMSLFFSASRPSLSSFPALVLCSVAAASEPNSAMGWSRRC